MSNLINDLRHCYKQEGDELHRKAADRIAELQAQVNEIPKICTKYEAEIKRLKEKLEWHLKTK